jgi:hypothetical protein
MASSRGTNRGGASFGTGNLGRGCGVPAARRLASSSVKVASAFCKYALSHPFGNTCELCRSPRPNYGNPSCKSTTWLASSVLPAKDSAEWRARRRSWHSRNGDFHSKHARTPCANREIDWDHREPKNSAAVYSSMAA